RIIGVVVKGEVQSAGHVLLASGAWTADVAKRLKVDLPIRPQRGQLVHLGQVNPCLRHIVFWHDIYLAPKDTGSILVGAANDYQGFENRPSVTGVSSLLVQGQEALPALERAEFKRAQAGLRPRTPDKLPIVGPLPRWEGISVATGHNTNGLLFSAVTAK